MHDMNVEALRANSNCKLARLCTPCALTACPHAQKATEPQPSTPA